MRECVLGIAIIQISNLIFIIDFYSFFFSTLIRCVVSFYAEPLWVIIIAVAVFCLLDVCARFSEMQNYSKGTKSFISFQRTFRLQFVVLFSAQSRSESFRSFVCFFSSTLTDIVNAEIYV